MTTLKIIRRNDRPWTCDDTERALSAIQEARPNLEMWPSGISINDDPGNDGASFSITIKQTVEKGLP